MLGFMWLSSPHGRSSGRAGRWLHSSLRLSPACCRGAWGGFASGPGGANQMGARAAGTGGGQNVRRPRARWRGAE